MTDDERSTKNDPYAYRREPSPLAGAGKYMGLGLQFGASIVLFMFGGIWLDRKLGSSPLFLIIGVFGGASAAFYNMYRKLMADQRREEESKR